MQMFYWLEATLWDEILSILYSDLSCIVGSICCVFVDSNPSKHGQYFLVLWVLFKSFGIPCMFFCISCSVANS